MSDARARGQNPNQELLKFDRLPTKDQDDEVKKYMIESGILTCLNKAMTQVLEEKPRDPKKMLIEQLRQIQKGQSDSS